MWSEYIKAPTSQGKGGAFSQDSSGGQVGGKNTSRKSSSLVLSVMKRFDSSNENADDLFQIGCVGLVKAVDNFDPDRQVKFSTYAVPMIIGEIAGICEITVPFA